MKKLIEATKWEVKTVGEERSIQLFDKDGNKLDGKDAYWAGNFDCYNNQLTSLNGAPREVGGNFHCSLNKLTSLKGAPQEVGGGLYCHNNQLTSLNGAPQEVGDSFNCSNNKLTSLNGAPQEVGDSFYCYSNQLTSLDGAPQEVGGGLYFHCNQLTSLNGAPREVGGNFYCDNNQLTSLNGAPQENCTSVKERIHKKLLEKGILFVDDIMAHIIKRRGSVFKIRKFGSKDHSWAVTNGEAWSHGSTLVEAKEDLIYKVSERDPSEFKLLHQKIKRDSKELIQIYKSITGSCSFGIKDFCKNIDMKKERSIEDVIRLTKGAYGHEKFKEFFE